MTSPPDLHFREEAELTWLGGPSLGGQLLGSAEPARLARLAGDGGTPLPVRLAAGAVLAVCGDPRTPRVPAVRPVPGGQARIGLPASQVDDVTARWRHAGVERSWIEKEVPVWHVRLDDFWLGQYPVTNGQYLAFLRATGYSRRPSTWYLGAYPWDRSNHPVCGVSAQDADAYVAWLSGLTGHPYRLPGEAEWEWAAKGHGGHEYPWGEEFDPGKANTRETGIHTTTPVGVFPAGAGPFGHFDLAGNVEEYTSGCYQPYPGGARVADHLTQQLGSYRVTRGGSFARYGDLARTRRRHGAFPGPLYPCGFRVATHLPPSQPSGRPNDQAS
jgi:formylglycine-generating enzyme required for sulfatase activity